jgi:FkbM family methyltransferase
VSLRSVAEAATHRLVIRRRLAAPYRDVRLYVSSESGLRYLKPRLDRVDPPLLRLVSEVVRPGHRVWDIGANIGLFTFTSALRAGPAGRVLAVEADTWNVGLLRRSAARMPPRAAPVDVLPAAASDRVGVARFHIAVRNRSTNHLEGAGSTQTGGVRETQVVPTLTLDHLLGHFAAPHVLKIDVEGAEALVLAGAAAVLRRRPVIVCEVAAANVEAVGGLLQPHGYRFYDGEALERRPVDRPPYATLAVPAATPAPGPSPS